jgi:Fe-S cluster biosynthesis and repair protein YggX
MAEKTVTRNATIKTARVQHKNQILQVKNKAANKRRWIKALIQPGINKKLLLGLVSKSLQADIKHINTTYQHQRQRLYNHHRRQTWLDWLQQQAKQGNNNALQLLRQRHVNSDQRGNYLVKSKFNNQENPRPTPTPTPTSHEPHLPKAKVTKKGTVF